MLISKRLELTFGPGVKNPVLDVEPCRVSIVLGLVPVGLHL